MYHRIQYPYIESVTGASLSQRVYAEISKKKILGVKCYGIMMPQYVNNHSFVFQMSMARMAFCTETDGNPNLLGVNANDVKSYLNAYNGNPTNKWNRENGFVFLSPKFSSFSVSL